MSAPADANGNISGRVVAATIVGMIAPTMAVVGRITARKLRAARLYTDDYLIIIALIFKLAIDVAGCILIEHGLGRHIDTVTPSEMTTFLKVQYTGSILYPFCTTFTKLSILYQYRRLFAGKFFRAAVDTLMVIMVLWCIAVCLTGVFLCTPIRKSWEPMIDGTCINLVSFYYGLQIPNVLTDFAILVLPLKEVIDLRLPKEQKVGVLLTCALWLLCLIFGIVRLIVMLELSSKGTDVTWTLTDAAVWTTVEPTVAVVTACLPSVRILYRSLTDFCNGRKGESHVLRNASDTFGITNDTTLVGNSQISRSDKKESYMMHDKSSASTVQSPISPTSQFTADRAPSEHGTKYSASEHTTNYAQSREDV